MKRHLLDLPYSRVQEILASLGFPRYRASQIWEAALGGRGVHDFQDITTLSLRERSELAASFTLRGSTISDPIVSADATVKWMVTPTLQAIDASSSAIISSKAGGGSSSSKGDKRVECVFIPELLTTPHNSNSNSNSSRLRRGTLCVSSQAGCSLACTFCHTGTQALSGNLSAAGVIEQVLLARDALRSPPLQQLWTSNTANSSSSSRSSPLWPISHLVLMGQGEPLLNWRAVSLAIRTLTGLPEPATPSSSPQQQQQPQQKRVRLLAPHRITLSTAGVAPLIPSVARDTPGVRLAISLHAPDDDTRSRVMGINARYPIAQLMAAVNDYVELRLQATAAAGKAAAASAAAGAAARSKSKSRAAAAVSDDDEDAEDEDEDEDDPDEDQLESLRHTPLKLTRYNHANRVRVTFEYVLLDGINDDPATHAGALAQLLRRSLTRGLPVAHVNLICFNPWPGAPYAGSPRERVRAFRDALSAAGVSVSVRRSRGQDALAACGQLRSATMLKPTAPQAAKDVVGQ